MNKFSELYENLKKLKKDQLFIILLVGVLLFVITVPVDKKQPAEQENMMVSKDTETVSALQIRQEKNQMYTECLEKKLKDTLMTVAGVGNVKVMITLEATAETVVEKDIPNTRNSSSEVDSAGGTRTSTDISSTESTVYMTDENGQQIPYVVMEIEPRIKGVVIVAGGGHNPVVVSAITEATQALFQIEPHKIKVMKMKNQN